MVELENQKFKVELERSRTIIVHNAIRPFSIYCGKLTAIDSIKVSKRGMEEQKKSEEKEGREKWKIGNYPSITSKTNQSPLLKAIKCSGME